MKILDTAIQKITYKIIHTLLTSDFCVSTSSSLSHDRKILPIPTAKSDAGSVFEALQKQCAAKRNKFNTYFIRRHFDQKNKFSPTFFIGDQLLLPLARCYMPIELFDSNQQFPRLAHSNFFFAFSILLVQIGQILSAAPPSSMSVIAGKSSLDPFSEIKVSLSQILLKNDNFNGNSGTGNIPVPRKGTPRLRAIFFNYRY